MIYTLAIDWLSVHCYYLLPLEPKPMDLDELPPLPTSPSPNRGENEWEPVTGSGELYEPYPWEYRLMDYGTRQFARLHKVLIPNAQGGWDEFAEVQSHPHSGILKKESVIVRFVNRTLYMPDFWELANRFLSENHFVFQGITRIDMCADFNNFASMAPLELIRKFASSELRHVGRGVGALYFNHGVMKKADAPTQKAYQINYTGLSFNTHASDVRVYLYNKSFELLTQGKKPWIEDTWKKAGLDIRNVWRLEISIKSKGCKFRDRNTKKDITITTDRVQDDDQLCTLYHTFRKKLFAFVVNDHPIKNITREPRVELFDPVPTYSRGVIRNLSPGNRFERMFIKALWQMGDLYRGEDMQSLRDVAQDLAVHIADSTDLIPWLKEKYPTWERPAHK